jgi:hypothetical protein
MSLRMSDREMGGGEGQPQASEQGQEQAQAQEQGQKQAQAQEQGQKRRQPFVLLRAKCLTPSLPASNPNGHFASHH